MIASLIPIATIAMKRALSMTLICFTATSWRSERMVGGWWADEPEPGSLGLLVRSLGAILSAIIFDLIVFCWPSPRSPAKSAGLGGIAMGLVMTNGFTFGHIDGNGDRRRHIDARRCSRPVIIRCIAAVVGAGLQDFCCDCFAKLDAVRFRCAIRDRCQVCRKGTFHFTVRAIADARTSCALA